MCNVKYMNADLLQVCISRGVILLPTTYFAFLNALLILERNNLICLVPTARFDLFHFKIKSNTEEIKKNRPFSLLTLPKL